MESDGLMPECGDIALMLGPAGDGELELGDLRQVAHHVERCPACTGELSDYSAIGHELRALVVMPALEGFTKSVLAAIAAIVVVAIFALTIHDNVNIVNVARSVPDAIASRPQAPSAAVEPVRVFDVRVDSAFVADTAFGSFSHTKGLTESGKMLVFKLPDGKTLHVQPRALSGGMISMEVVLFDGDRPTMTANLKLGSGDTFALSGETYGGATLLIRISPRISPITAAIASPGPPSS